MLYYIVLHFIILLYCILLYCMKLYYITIDYILFYVIYIYSHPGVDRISDIFNPDFQKKSWNMFKTLSFSTFFVPVKVMISQFWTRVWRNIEKTQKSTNTKK